MDPALTTDGEDEVLEIVNLGSGEVALLRTGIAMARLRARSAYIAGRITVEQFEAEIGRLMHKEAGLGGSAAP